MGHTHPTLTWLHLYYIKNSCVPSSILWFNSSKVTDMSIFLLPKGNSSWVWLWLSRRWLKYTCKTLFPIRKLCLHIVVALRGFTCTNMVTEILWCREGLKTYQQAPEKAEQWQPGSSDIHRNFDIIMSEDRISQKMFMKPHTWRP